MSGGRRNPEQRPRWGGMDPYERERRRHRRRRSEREARRFDPSPPGEDDYAVPEADRLRRVSAPEPLGEVLEGVAARRDWSERLRGSLVLSRWPQVVGEDLAERCEPVRLAGGILVVRARSQAWATELRYMTDRIRGRANTLLDEELVEQVQVVVGDLREGGTDDTDA